MIGYRDNCVGCFSVGLSCLGDSCPNKHVPYIECDKCGEEVDEVYDIDGEHVCNECLMSIYPVIRVNDL